jgi:hypothetical protein
MVLQVNLLDICADPSFSFRSKNNCARSPPFQHKIHFWGSSHCSNDPYFSEMDLTYEGNENNLQTEAVPSHATDERPEPAPAQEHEDIIFRSPLPFNPIVVPPAGLTLHGYVMQNIENYLDRVALVDTSDGRHYTYGQVQRLVKSVASGLWNRFGIRKGDVVLILLPNVAEFFIFVLGIFSIGAIYSGSNPAAHEHEIHDQAANSGAKLVITDVKTHKKVAALGVPVVVMAAAPPPGSHSHLSLLEADGSQAPEVEISQHDVCALPYSSGTTGVSKGVMITHRNVVANLSQTLADLERAFAAGRVPNGEDHVVLGLMPFFHIYGICGICCASMRLKGKVVVMARYAHITSLQACATTRSSQYTHPAACFQIQLAGLPRHTAQARCHLRPHCPPDSSPARENRPGLRPQPTQTEVRLDSRSAARHRAPTSLRGQVPRRGSSPGRVSTFRLISG